MIEETRDEQEIQEILRALQLPKKTDVTRSTCWRGLLPGMEVEVSFENMEDSRMIILVAPRRKYPEIMLMPIETSIVGPRRRLSLKERCTVMRIFPACQEYSDEEQANHGWENPTGAWTLIDPQGEITGLRQISESEPSAVEESESQSD